MAKEKGEEMKQLEKYYNEQFKQKGDPEFKELSEDDKKSIAKSLEFAFYELGTALDGITLAFGALEKALKKAK